MVSCSLNYRHSRARKARWQARWGKLAARSLTTAGSLFVAGGLDLLWYHHPLGYSALGVALLAAIGYIWERGDLGHLPVDARALSTETIQLELVLESGLLGRLPAELTAANMWQAALAGWEGIFVIQRLGLPYPVITDLLGQRPVAVDAVWQKATQLIRTGQYPEIDCGVVISATLLASPELSEALSHLKLTPEDVISVLAWQQRSKQALRNLQQIRAGGGIGRDWASGYTPLLNHFAANLSHEVEDGYYRHIPNIHQSIIDQLVGYLGENQATVLVGGIGSGRTSLVYALAERMLQNDRAGGLRYHQVMELNASVLLSAPGKIEDIVMQLLAEAVQSHNTIIFLDEANLFLSSGEGAVDLSQILLPILQRRVVKLILAMTDHDWQQLVARQPALAGSLQRLAVPEPHKEAVVQIVQDAAIGIEHAAAAVTLQVAVSEAVRLAERYLPEMAFPGKAITVLGNAAHYAQGGFITAASVQQAVQATTGAKVVATSQPERQQLLNLEKQIHERMINQDRAVKAVAAALRRSRAGVGNPKRPVGSFLFLGPTGVGKTELAKALAATYYGQAAALVRLDMSEYQQPSDLARLLAPVSGRQQGSTLAAAVRRQPSSVVLLDEIEKAHPDILNLLLQILDEGQLTDSDGRAVSFKDAIVIATSNAAAADIREHIAAGQSLESFESQIIEQIMKSGPFRPELLNRFDEIVLFRPLTKPELRQVVDIMTGEVNATLAPQHVTVRLTAAAADWLVEHGYDPALGARPLRRIVQRTVENVVAERLLAGSLSAGQTLTLDASDLSAANAVDSASPIQPNSPIPK